METPEFINPNGGQINMDFEKAARRQKANQYQIERAAKEYGIDAGRFSHNYEGKLFLDGEPFEKGYKKLILERRQASKNTDKRLN